MQAEVRINIGIGQHEEEVMSCRQLRQAEIATEQRLQTAIVYEHRSIGLCNTLSSENAALKFSEQNTSTASASGSQTIRALEGSMAMERHQLLAESNEKSSSIAALKTSMDDHKKLVRRLEHELEESKNHNESYADSQSDKAKMKQLEQKHQEMLAENLQYEMEVDDLNQQVDTMQEQL
jgi:hypothetical protein